MSVPKVALTRMQKRCTRGSAGKENGAEFVVRVAVDVKIKSQ